MNVATIEVPREEVQSKLREYRKRVHAGAETEYSRVLQAYEAAANGKPLLVLSQVLEQAPRDTKARPMLAIARADRRQVKVTVRDQSDLFDVSFGWGSRIVTDAQVTVRRPIVDEWTQYRARLRREYPNDSWQWDNPQGYSLVPIVPPDVARGHQLAKRFILWEVEAWADEPIGANPDKDPYLLQRIADDLYAVVGEWDLTPLEQAIMRGRAR